MAQGTFDSLFFRLMTEQAPTICWALDRQLRFTAGMGAGLIALGITDPTEHIGRTLYEFLGTDDDAHPAVAAAINALNGISSDYEDNFGGRDFESHIEPLRDDDGMIIGCVGLAVDVTSRKEAERKLRQNVSRMQQSFLLGPSANLLVRADDLTVEEVSERFIEVTGRTRSQVINKPLPNVEVFSPEVVERIRGLESRHASFRDLATVMQKEQLTIHGLVSGVRFDTDDGDRIKITLTDITRQQLAVQEDVETFSKQSHFLKVVPAMVYQIEGRLDPFEFRLNYISPGVEELLGVTAEECYEDPDKFVGCIHPDDRSGYVVAIAESMQNGSTLKYEFRLASNPTRWIHFEARMEGDPQGWHSYTGMAMDITHIKEREFKAKASFEEVSRWYYSGQKLKQEKSKQAELEARRRQELQDQVTGEVEFQKTLFEAMPVILVEFDETGQILEVGGGGLKNLAPDADAAREAISKLLPPNCEEVRLMLQGEFQSMTQNTASPATLPYDVLLIPSSKGRPRPRALLVDNSDQELVEKLLRRSEEKWRSLADSAVDYVVVIDESATIEYVNRSESTPEGLQVGANLLDIFGEVDRQRVASHLEDVLKTGRMAQMEVEAFCEDAGEKKTYTARIAPMFDRGRVVAATFFATDITVRKRAENALRDEQRLLRKLLSIQELERQVVAYEVHDGLVQGVVGAHLKLQRALELAEKLDGKLHERLQQMDDFLQIAIEDGRRLISGLRPIILDERGLADGLRLYVDEINGQVATNIRLITFLSTERFPDEVENTLFRIAQEALQNVRRHSQAQNAFVSLKADETSITLTVEDDGCGFNPADVPKDHFGLEGMIHRARLFGGRAKIDSKPGEGTSVTVTLPLELPT